MNHYRIVYSAVSKMFEVETRRTSREEWKRLDTFLTRYSADMYLDNLRDHPTTVVREETF
jgi:hypothetical protein